MNREAQALADALAGNIRVWIPVEAYTMAHVKNVLMKAGMPIKWTITGVNVERGRLTRKDQGAYNQTDVIEFLWEPDGHPFKGSLHPPHEARA